MAGLLKDPKLLLQVIAMLIAICVPLTIFYLNKRRDRKGLSYGISILDVTTIRHGYESKVEVLFDGHPAPKTSLLVVNIKNSGRAPIRPDDFVEALQLKMPRGARVLSMEVTEQNPKDLNAKLTLETEGEDTNFERRDSVKLLPLLLNGGDSLSIEVLASNFSKKEVTVNARIVGVSKVEEHVPGTSKTQVTFESPTVHRWSWYRFRWGCLGAAAPEIFRAYKAFAAFNVDGITVLLFFVISVAMIALGGIFASAWEDSRPIKCIYIGATFPVWLSGWTHIIGADLK